MFFKMSFVLDRELCLIRSNMKSSWVCNTCGIDIEMRSGTGLQMSNKRSNEQIMGTTGAADKDEVMLNNIFSKARSLYVGFP